MKVIFKDPDLETLFANGSIAKGRYKMLSRNKKLVEGYQRAVNIMYAVDCTEGLRAYSFLHYEKLRNDPRSSVRVKKAVWNGCFSQKLQKA